MRERGMDFRTLGKRTHVDYSHLNRIRNGKKSPNIDLARSCDRALGTTPELTELFQRLRRCRRSPAQLPAAPPRFVGRADEVVKLTDAVLRSRPRGAPAVAVITGPAGSGKTALAVKVAHIVSERFPDGNLYSDLNGHGSDALTPATVLQDFLTALGERVPDPPRQRETAFRSALKGRRILILLDNAGAGDQIGPLLPAERHCAVIVTSRQRIPAVHTSTSSDQIDLGPLSEGEAARVLHEVLGGRVVSDPAVIRQVARQCGNMPGRLVAAAEWVLSDPARSLEHLTERDLDHISSARLH